MGNEKPLSEQTRKGIGKACTNPIDTPRCLFPAETNRERLGASRRRRSFRPNDQQLAQILAVEPDQVEGVARR